MALKPLYPPPPMDKGHHSSHAPGGKIARRGKRGGHNGSCLQCDETWSRKQLQHCGGAEGCHELYDNIEAFDHHRKLGFCRPPHRDPEIRKNEWGAWELV